MGQGESFAYDETFGQQTLHVSFEGRVTEFAYDNTAGASGRLVQKRFWSSKSAHGANPTTPERTVGYTYDALGRVTESVDSLTGTWSYGYDADGRQTRVTSPQGTVRYEYDDLGRVTRTYTGALDDGRTSIASDGKAVTDTRYTYDQLGRLKTVSVHEGQDAPLATVEQTGYVYDKVGNLDLIEQANGVTSDYFYDGLNRLTKLEQFIDANGNEAYDTGEVLKGQYAYELNADGTRKTATEIDDQGTQRVFHWGYDGLNRLVSEAHGGPDDLFAGTTEDYITAYGHDLVSNRLTKSSDTGADGWTDVPSYLSNPAFFSPDETTTSTFDALFQR